MSSYKHAYALLSTVQQREIDGLLEAWEIEYPQARKIVNNVKEFEHFLPVENMFALLNVLLRFSREGTEPFDAFYCLACRHHVREGDKIRSSMPTTVCRAVEQEIFSAWIYKKYGSIFHIEDGAKEFLEKIVNGDPLTLTENTLYMSEYSAWVTWSAEGLSGRPVHEISSAQLIRESLGLDPEGRYVSDLLLLLIYDPPRGLFRPTIADAELHFQFEPPPPAEESHGLTRPLRVDLPRRPEAIHEPVSFYNLKFARSVAP